MTNIKLRTAMKEKGVRYYELAGVLNIHETTLSKMLRFEMDEELSDRLMKLVDDIAGKKTTGNNHKQVMNHAMKSRIMKGLDEISDPHENKPVEKSKTTENDSHDLFDDDLLKDLLTGL